MFTSSPQHAPNCIIFGAFFVFISTFGLTHASAHENIPERRVIVSVLPHPTTQTPTIQTLILTRISPHPRVRFLVALHDLNRDGELQPPEALALAGALSPQLMRDLRISLDSTLLSPTDAQARASVSSDGTLSLAVLLSYPPTAKTHTQHRVSLLPPPQNPSQPRSSSLPYQWPIAELQLNAPYTLAASSHPPARDALVLGPVALVPGSQGLWIQFTPRPPTQP